MWQAGLELKTRSNPRGLYRDQELYQAFADVCKCVIPFFSAMISILFLPAMYSWTPTLLKIGRYVKRPRKLPNKSRSVLQDTYKECQVALWVLYSIYKSPIFYIISSTSSPSAASRTLSAASWLDVKIMKCSWSNCSLSAEHTRSNKLLQVFSLRSFQPLPHIPRQLLMLLTSFWTRGDQMLERKSQHSRISIPSSPKPRFLDTCMKHSVSRCIFPSNQYVSTDFMFIYCRVGSSGMPVPPFPCSLADSW